MVSNSTDLVTDDSGHASAVFFCPTKPIFTWILSDTTTFQATIAISCIACPITVFLKDMRSSKLSAHWEGLEANKRNIDQT